MNARKAVTGVMLALAAFNMAACTSSPQEQAAHQDAVESAVSLSMQKCDRTGGVNNSRDAYNLRLRQVLENTSTKTLQEFSSRDIAFCLDQRLVAQQGGGKHIRSIFYGAEGIVTMPDNGMAKKEGDWFQDNPAFSTSISPQKLLSKLSSQPELAKDVLIAGRYRSGKHRTTRWKPAAQFSQASIRNNPQLMTAPAAARPQGPRAP